MPQRAATEVTTRYATHVDTITEAFAFVMEHLEKVGPAPEVNIGPCWSSEDDFDSVYFGVVVSGMVEEKSDDSQTI